MHARKHAALAGIFFKAHHAVDLGEQSEIPAHADARAGIHSGAQLTNQNISSQHALAAETLDAAPLSPRCRDRCAKSRLLSYEP